ncbi:MAG TPA: hypothetical protein VK137_21385, partial [Planctomycetaceae bacterium]|nr:hypothetical protein [Planctomycetaceae bacterium]
MGQLILPAAVTLVLVPLAVYAARYWWDRRRWRTFRELIRAWTGEEFFPEDLTEEDWKALAVMKLSDAGFEPCKIRENLELAVCLAKAHVSQEAR